MSHRQLSTSTDVPAWPANALPERWIESLFERMHLAYGTRFADQWRGTDPKALQRFWAEKLGVLTADQLKAGVAKLDTLEWPPTLPQFLKLCQPAADATVAYYEAVAGIQARQGGSRGEWSHPAVYWAAVTMAHDLLTQTYSQVKARWERAFDDQMRRGAWPEIPEPSKALPAPGQTHLTRERAAKLVSDYRERAGVQGEGQPVDHKRWARFAIEKHKAGQYVLPLTLKWAMEVMHV